MVLRILLLKQIRDFSLQELSREVRANLVYGQFTCVGGGKVPDDKSMGRLARQLEPELIKRPHDRFVAKAREENIIQRRRMRVDTTVVDTEERISALGLLRGPGLGSYRTAWNCLPKLRYARMRPGREQLSGTVEANEA